MSSSFARSVAGSDTVLALTGELGSVETGAGLPPPVLALLVVALADFTFSLRTGAKTGAARAALLLLLEAGAMEGNLAGAASFGAGA